MEASLREATVSNFECGGKYAIIKFEVSFAGDPENIAVAFQPDADAESVFDALNEHLNSIGVASLSDEQLAPARAAVKKLHTKKVRDAVVASKKMHEQLLDIDHKRLSGEAEDVAEYNVMKAAADAAKAKLIDAVSAAKAA